MRFLGGDYRRPAVAVLIAMIAATLTAAGPITVEPGAPAATMVAKLVGPSAGIQVIAGSESYIGAPIASGLFSGAEGILPFAGGIVLTTGSAALVPGPNNAANAGLDNGTAGNSTLSAIAGAKTFNAALLSFSFIPASDTISFQYVFGSEEYNEFVGSPASDVFAFLLNGVNIALIPGTMTPVTVKTVNAGINSECFTDNAGGALNLQYDGLVGVRCAFFATGHVNPGSVNTITIAIADTADKIYDSGVFLTDFRSAAKGSIGDFVWKDLNENGIQDPGEPGFGGVMVRLLKPDGSVDGTTTTDPSGRYQFTNLGLGSHIIDVVTPAGYIPTLGQLGSDRSADSDGSPATVLLTSDQPDRSDIDFGYRLPRPAIALVKLTNGTDNDESPGRSIPVGSPVTWTYIVSNTGNVPLTNVVVTDDKLGTVCTIATLVAGETRTTPCQKTGVASACQYENLGTVVGTPPVGQAVTNHNVEHYFGTSSPVVSCVQSVNPSGANIPRAHKTNEDGFYRLSAKDACGIPKVALGGIALADGETIKLTQAPGKSGVRLVDTMGPLAIKHFQVGPRDAVIEATNAQGMAASVTCLVPPPPK